MVLTGYFGKKAAGTLTHLKSTNKVVDFISEQNRAINKVIEQQLSSCMREIQMLMAEKNNKLKRFDTVKIS